MTVTHSASLRRRRLRVGSLWVDAVSFDEAIGAIENLVDAGQGGAVYTPNVDHVVKAESNGAFRSAYDDVSLSLADGMPLVWVSRLLGCRLPERVAGSDILIPLMKLAAKRRWRVYLLGGGPGAAEAAAKRLVDEFGVSIVGWDDCREKDGAVRADSRSRARTPPGQTSFSSGSAPRNRSSGSTDIRMRWGRRWRSPSERGSTFSRGGSAGRRAGSRTPGSNGRIACCWSLAGSIADT
jgi:hypothetical protein